MITQKSGVLLLPILLLVHVRQHGVGRLASLLPYSLSLVPLLSLQLYLFLLFGDPLVNVQAHKKIFSDAYFTVPFRSMLAGLSAPDQVFVGHLWLRKMLIGGSCLGYVWIFASSWLRRSPATAALQIWLGVVLVFNLSLRGMWGYYGFPRFMLVATPAALILLADLVHWRPKPWVRVAGVCIAGALSVSIATLDIESAVELVERWWTKTYFWQFDRYILGGE
jgi:hypothetical protein